MGLILSFRKFKKILLPALLSAVTAGCTLGASADSLLTPPKLSEEQSEIYSALEKAAGTDIYLIYPKSGTYRSAFVIENIDDEPSPEAIVFYEKAGEHADGSGSNIRINVLDKTDGKWRSVYEHAGTGTEIERIMFSSIGDSDEINIIIGYGMISGEKNVRVYNYRDGLLNMLYTGLYSSVFVSDMDRNNENELVVLHPNSKEEAAFICFVSKKDDEFFESSRVELNPETTDYVNLAYGYIGSTTTALFIDGLSDGLLTTEIVYAINGNLRNPVYHSESGLLSQTSRPPEYLCTDIDNDGFIEIPTLALFQGYNEESPEKLYITDWNVFENYSIVKKYSSYYDIKNEYCFILPARWDNIVTAGIDGVTGDIVFYKYKTDINANAQNAIKFDMNELLRFTVVSSAEEAENKLLEGYTLIKTMDRLYYLMKAPVNADEPLLLTNTEIINNFYILGD